MFAFAEYEADMIAERTSEGKAEKRALRNIKGKHAHFCRSRNGAAGDKKRRKYFSIFSKTKDRNIKIFFV